MKKLFAIIWKDTIVRFSSLWELVFFIVLPIIFTFLLAGGSPGGEDDSRIRLLVVDEAHSFGMTGTDAGGLAVAQGVAERVPFRTGSFSKAIGGHGGFVAGSAAAMWHLRHFGRPMIFSSAVLPCDVAAHLEALHIAQQEPELAANALGMAASFRQALESRGIKHSGSQCQIVSISLPKPRLASVAYARLRDLGVLASVFVPPGVSVGTSALRFTFHAAMDVTSVERAAYAVEQALGDLLPHRLAV